MPNVRFRKSAYSRSRRRTRTSRAARIAKARKTNAPVKRLRRRMARAPLKYKNAKSISVLARQVTKLQNQHWGDLQYQRQTCQFVTTGPGSTQGPINTSPVAFAVNCFYNETPWYRGIVNAQTGECFYGTVSAPGANIVQWVKSAAALATPAIAAESNWMQMTNFDTISTTQYMPITAFHIFKVRIPVLLYTGPIKFKFQFIKTKRLPNRSSAIKVSLPTYLGAYHSLASGDLTTRRQLSKKYHKVLQTKYITIGNKDIGAAPGLQTSISTGKTTVIEKTVTMNYQFTRRDLVRPDFTGNETQQAAALAFHDAIDGDDIVWCLVSSNIEKWQSPLLAPGAGTSPPVYAQPYELECFRYIKWRDQDGEVWGGGPYEGPP